jgi:hypothetical protein
MPEKVRQGQPDDSSQQAIAPEFAEVAACSSVDCGRTLQNRRTLCRRQRRSYVTLFVRQKKGADPKTGP